MDRITEPALMIEPDQVDAFAVADFSEVNESYVRLFAHYFPDPPPRAVALDLCCGPGDVTLRFARAYDGWTFDAVDGSRRMLDHAERVSARVPSAHVRWIEGTLPDLVLPRDVYDVVLCTGSLHHVHDPAAFWTTVLRCVRKGSIVFVTDFFRPESAERATELVDLHASSAPAVLRRDYFNSLCAAFSPAELHAQLRAHGLASLHVDTISDRHVVVAGRIA